MSDMPAQNPTQDPSYVDTYQPPVAGKSPTAPSSLPDPVSAPTPGPSPSPAASPTASPTQSRSSESLEDQNIFELLGVTQATDQEKEAFLDELQQVIWEDFLENDAELLLTAEEVTQLRTLLQNNAQDQLAQQEAAVTFLEKLIPDLEEIMLEKALELKADMVKERIAGMKEYYAGQTEKLAQISKAEDLIREDTWRSAAEALNGIT